MTLQKLIDWYGTSVIPLNATLAVEDTENIFLIQPTAKSEIEAVKNLEDFEDCGTVTYRVLRRK